MTGKDLAIGIVIGCVAGAAATYVLGDHRGKGDDVEIGRFQIQPVGMDLSWTVWRVDTHTGEIWLCDYNRGSPKCDALPKPPVPFEPFTAEDLARAAGK